MCCPLTNFMLLINIFPEEDPYIDLPPESFVNEPRNAYIVSGHSKEYLLDGIGLTFGCSFACNFIFIYLNHKNCFQFIALLLTGQYSQ